MPVENESKDNQLSIDKAKNREIRTGCHIQRSGDPTVALLLLRINYPNGMIMVVDLGN